MILVLGGKSKTTRPWTFSPVPHSLSLPLCLLVSCLSPLRILYRTLPTLPRGMNIPHTLPSLNMIHLCPPISRVCSTIPGTTPTLQAPISLVLLCLNLSQMPQNLLGICIPPPPSMTRTPDLFKLTYCAWKTRSSSVIFVASKVVLNS